MEIMNIEARDQDLPYNDQMQGEEIVGQTSEDSNIIGGATTIGAQGVNEADNLVEESKQVQMFNNDPINFLPSQRIQEQYSPVLSKQPKMKEFGTSKYRPKRPEKWRNMDIEIANEALLRKMVQIVNVSFQF